MEETHVVICLSIATDSCTHSPTNLNPPVKPVLKNKTVITGFITGIFQLSKVSNASMEHDLLILSSIVLTSLQASTLIQAVKRFRLIN